MVNDNVIWTHFLCLLNLLKGTLQVICLYIKWPMTFWSTSGTHQISSNFVIQIVLFKLNNVTKVAARKERIKERERELVLLLREERNWELVLILAKGTERELVLHFWRTFNSLVMGMKVHLLFSAFVLFTQLAGRRHLAALLCTPKF